MAPRKPKKKGATNVDRDGLDFIAAHEGEVLHGYNDSAGHCTIGVGHLLHLGRCSSAELARRITHDQAIVMLGQDVGEVVRTIRDAVKEPLSQNEFNALASLGFNIGVNGLASSTLVARINAKAKRSEITAAFLMWNLPPEIRGRRQDEVDLFNQR